MKVVHTNEMPAKQLEETWQRLLRKAALLPFI